MKRGSQPGSHLQQNFAMDDDPAVFRAALASANGFSDTELKTNRSGRIALSQYPRVIMEAFRPAVYAGVVLLGWIFVLYFRDLVLPQVAVDLMKRAWSFLPGDYARHRGRVCSRPGPLGETRLAGAARP